MKALRGFTLFELLIVLLVVAFLVTGVCYLLIGGAVVMGNQWFIKDDVLKKIQLDHPNTTRVVDAERNVFKYSVITVEQGGGRTQQILHRLRHPIQLHNHRVRQVTFGKTSP